MNRKTEFILIVIPAVWQTLILALLAIVPVLTRHYYSFTYQPTLWLVMIHLFTALFLWIAAFEVKRDKRVWGLFVLAVGVLLSVYDYFNFVVNILLVIAGVMVLFHHAKPQISAERGKSGE